jgi:ribosomal protein L11 methylase PrmA
VASFLELSFDLGPLDAQRAEEAGIGCGADAVTFVDAHDDPLSRGGAVLEPAAGEFRLWPATRVKCLFAADQAPQGLTHVLAAALGIDAALIEAREIPDRAWEREWLKDFHALRFGARLWVCPRHERVEAPGAIVVHLDPGLAFGTGTHPSTALCLAWLDAHLLESATPAEHSVERRAHGLDAHLLESATPAEHSVERRAHGLDAHLLESATPAEHSVKRRAHGLDAHLLESATPGARVIDYGCGSGILGIAAAKLGAAEVHAFDIDPQALIATRDNALANDVGGQFRVHESPGTLPDDADLLVANILSGTLCALSSRFAALVRPRGQIVLGGLMEHEAADVTDAYAACFDVARVAECDGWVCLAGRRR